MYHPWVTFHSLSVFDFDFFAHLFLWATKGQKIEYFAIFDLSWPIKWVKIKKIKNRRHSNETVKRHSRMVHAQGNVSRMFTVLKKCTYSKGRFEIS